MIASKAVIYARVSSKEQEESGFSIPAQLKLLREYAQRHGFIIEQEFVDVETAKQSGRSGFGQMVCFLKESPSITTILVEKTDRLYRNFRDYVTIDDLDVAIHLVKEGEILSQDSRSHQKFIHGIRVLMAKNYIDNLSEEVKKGHIEKCEQGEYPSYAPIGYRNNLQTHVIEPHETEGPAVRKLYELYATGQHSLRQLKEIATSLGLKGRRSGRQISRSEVERILKNSVYYGEFVWDGRRYKGIHAPLITKELFDLVQQQLNHRNLNKHRSRQTFAYGGWFRCGHCGCSLTPERHGSSVYYRCTASRGPCSQPYLKEAEVAQIAEDLVKRVQLEPWQVEALRDALLKSYADKEAYHEAEIQALEAQRAALKRRLEQTYLDKLEGNISEEFWKEKTAEWRAEQDTVNHQLSLFERANRAYIDEGARIFDFAQHVYTRYQSATSPVRRTLFSMVLTKCALRGPTPCPTYRKPFGWWAEGLLFENGGSDGT